MRLFQPLRRQGEKICIYRTHYRWYVMTLLKRESSDSRLPSEDKSLLGCKPKVCQFHFGLLSGLSTVARVVAVAFTVIAEKMLHVDINKWVPVDSEFQTCGQLPGILVSNTFWDSQIGIPCCLTQKINFFDSISQYWKPYFKSVNHLFKDIILYMRNLFKLEKDF